MPIYEEFFRAVRAVNARLPKERQLRVLLADPPIEWENVHPYAQWMSWSNRGASHVMNLLRSGHFLRHVEDAFDGDLRPMRSLRYRIEHEGPASVFSVWTNTTVPLALLDGQVPSWPVPHLVALRGTNLGRLNFSAFAGVKSGLRVGDQYEAILYLGPPLSITMSELPEALCRDEAYVRMRLARRP